MDVARHNRSAWDRLVAAGSPWTVPVTRAHVDAARRGEWSVVLTPVRPVPREWLGELSRARVLCLACGGGQQGPILAAAGADVAVLDNSPAQLAQDRGVAEREGLALRLELGLMHDLSRFADGSFDLVFHPVSNAFVPDVHPVWREAHRVLRPGGRLLAGFCNPVVYLFDSEAEDRGELVLRHSIPYSDLEARTPGEIEQLAAAGTPLEFGHTLEDQIGGQIAAGFAITGFYEDGQPGRLLHGRIPLYGATRAEKRGRR